MEKSSIIRISTSDSGREYERALILMSKESANETQRGSFEAKVPGCLLEETRFVEEDVNNLSRN